MNKILVLSLMALLLISIASAQSESPQIKITLLNQEPDPARAGDIADLRFRLENIGRGVVENLELELMNEYPFTVIDGNATRSFDTLYAYQTGTNYINTRYTVKVDRDAVKGQHEVKLRYRYGSSEGWITSSFNVDVTSKEFAQIIYLDKAKLDPGKETKMTFTITNIGSAPLQNLVFSWSEKNGIILPVFSDDTKYIKYLDVGASAELGYSVVADVNSKPGLYQLDLKLKYESLETENTEINTKAGVFVGGETDFDVTFSESSAGQTSLSVANAGNNPALSVSVKIPAQPNFRVSGSTSSIIGNLDRGDYTIVSFQISQSGGGFGGSAPNTSSANGQAIRQRFQTGQIQGNGSQNSGGQPGSNDLKVVIEYTDTTGERKSVEKEVPIQFRTAAGAESAQGFGSGQFQRPGQTSFWKSRAFLISAGVILIAGFVLYRKKSSKKKRMYVLKKN